MILLRMIIMFLIKWLISYLRRRAYRQTWQYKMLQELCQMQHKLTEFTAQDTAIKLSEIIRRLAMYKSSRIDCAGLVGKVWLQWLGQNDNYKFDWEKYGQILIESSYAPPNKANISLQELSKLIEATKKWVV